MRTDPVTAQRTILADLDRAWYAALLVLVSPLLFDVVGVAPFIPAYLTVAVWSSVAALRLRRPTISDRTYAGALLALALVGVAGLAVLVVLRQQSWLALTTGVVISAICLDSFRASSVPRRS